MDLRAVIAVASYEIVSIAYSAVALRIAPMNTCAATLFLISFGSRWRRAEFLGAGDRGRTGDVQLGKLAFYH
jgi:hypothetical protein